jgi:hypothetical protein
MTDRFIARTGRVQDWLDNPDNKLPVSCTCINVSDSMEGADGIQASWTFVSHALRNAAGVAVHLSELRPRGTENGKGLCSSGPVSFARIYSGLNETLRRGGFYKGGAVVIHIDATHDDIEEFVDAPRKDLPWVKKCIDVTRESWNTLSKPLRNKILKAIQSGDIWLNKITYDRFGNRLFGNVCLEIKIPSRGTCLLQHIQLGQCNIEDLVPAFTAGMSQLCELHGKTGVGDTGEYLPSWKDRQVGLGVLGLANFLRIHGVSYLQFGEALKAVNDGTDTDITPAIIMAREWVRAVSTAAQIARVNKMERAFTIAPTASCSYRYKDLDGYTTAPEIAPPISRHVDRDSDTHGVASFDYGPVEIASSVGWDTYRLVADEICRTFEDTNLFHGYSFNTWSDVITYDDKFINDWFDSPQTSIYYSLQVNPDTLRKDDAASLLEGDDYADLFGFDTEDDPLLCSSCAE